MNKRGRSRGGGYILFPLLFLLLLLSYHFQLVASCDHHHHHHNNNHHFVHDDENDDDPIINNNKEEEYFHSSHLVRSLRGNNNNNNSHSPVVATTRDLNHNAECGFIEPSKDDIAADQDKMRMWKQKRSSSNNVMQRSSGSNSNENYVIPTYFHIVQPTIITGMIVTNERIDEYVTYLNNAFYNSNAPFTFQYINTTITIDTKWGNSCGLKNVEVAIKRKLKIGGAESLNIYICNEVTDRNGFGSLAGYSILPHTDSNKDIQDGVVLSRDDTDERLNTLVHEVGHFMGLYHTFGQNTCDPDSIGDAVDDTPQHLTLPDVNCHSNPIGWDTCKDIAGKDPVDNYMTYSSDNLCRSKFTPGQVERMIAQYEIYRLPYASKSSDPSVQTAVLKKPAKNSGNKDDNNNNNDNKPNDKSPDPPPQQPQSGGGISSIKQIIQDAIGKHSGSKQKSCYSFLEKCKSNDDCCSGNCYSLYGKMDPLCWI